MAKQSVIDLEKEKNSAKRTELNAPTFDYTESKGAEQNWDAYNNYRTTQKPASAQGAWTDSLNKTVNQIMNKEKFSYDLNADALYQQYKDQAIRNGNLAMMDTMGQAQAMTGGYGNSYAQSVGQQAYNSYLQQLDDKVPELYKLALDQYNQEVQNLYDKAGLLWKMDDSEYVKSQDALNNYYKELGVLFDNAKYMSDTEYNRALDNFKIMYDSYRNAVADDQWSQNMQWNKDRAVVEDDQWKQTFDAGIEQFNASQSNKGSSNGSDSKYKNLDVGSTAYNTILSDIDAVENIDSLYNLVERYISLGYNPDQINAMTSAKASELQNQKKPKTPTFSKAVMSPFLTDYFGIL